MTTKQDLRENNVRAVITAALELFLKNGIDNSSIEDIAALANVSKMSVFRYFDSKIDIVNAATIELFGNTEFQFKKGNFTDDSNMLNGMQLAKKQLGIFTYIVNGQPQFLNYMCELVIFFSKHEVKPNFTQNKQLEELWIIALEKGMSDKSIAYIKNYKTFYRTIHSLFVGVILRLYLEKKDLSSPDILEELKGRTKRIVDMTIKYLEP